MDDAAWKITQSRQRDASRIRNPIGAENRELADQPTG
jgi:hypothetical protein